MTLLFTIGWRSLLVVLLMVVFDPVRCTMPTTVSVAAEFPPVILIAEGKTTQGYPYLTGGVGADERAAMEERGKAYNVKLAFAERRGPYLADVSVVIADGKGKDILSLPSTGPWFYIQLPAGRYNIKATYKKQSKEIKNLQVEKNKSLKLTLGWQLAEE